MIVVLLMSGCAAQKELYTWGEYEPQVYAHFNGESPEHAIALLEKDLAIAEKNQRKLPPGFHAHLGMLYHAMGRDQDCVTMLELEKKHYPESRHFMNVLLRQYKR